MEFDEVEKEIANVDPDKYSYICLMDDCHKLFEIKSNFVNMVMGTGQYLRNDDDVMLMFHKYRKRSEIGIYVYEYHIPISIEKGNIGGSTEQHNDYSIVKNSCEIAVLKRSQR